MSLYFNIYFKTKIKKISPLLKNDPKGQNVVF